MEKRLLIIIVCSISIVSFALETEKYVLPIPIDLERDYYSNIYAEFKSEKSEIVLLDKIKPMDEIDNVFTLLMSAVKNNSFDTIKDFSWITDAPSQYGPAGLLSWYHQNDIEMRKKGDLLCLRTVVGNNQKIFIWGVENNDKQSNNKYIIAGDIIAKRKNGVFWYWLTSVENRNSSSLLCSLFRSGKLVKVTEDKKSDFSFVVDDATNSRAITLFFNGRTMNYGVNEPLLAEAGEIERFYKMFHDKLVANPKDCVEYFTKKGRKSFAIEVSDEKYAMQIWRLQEFAKNNPKQLWFVIDATPVYIVFYTVLNGIHGDLYFDILLKEDDGLKFANYSCVGDYFSTLLRTNKENIKNIIKKAKAK